MTTGIEWTDETWNPVRGCTRVSPECLHCYAERQAIRQSKEGKAYHGLVRSTSNGPQWTGAIRAAADKLDEPLRWRTPKRIFVNSMSDLFHEDVLDGYILQVLDIVRRCSYDGGADRTHTFQVLTKRPARMAAFMKRLRFNSKARHDQLALYLSDEGRYPLTMSNLWLGVSAGNQQYADERIPLLLQTPAAVRFVSYEPALGPVDFSKIMLNSGCTFDAMRSGDVGHGGRVDRWPALDWIIAGGESGPNARPAHPDWFRAARDQCAAAGVAFFFKQWGEHLPGEIALGSPTIRWQNGLTEWWGDHQDIKYSDSHLDTKSDGTHIFSHRVGKKAAGRRLDGRDHGAFPDTEGRLQ